jgi:hypothetical protein
MRCFQYFAKYENRKNLVLSIGMPVIEFLPEHIEFVDDIRAFSL